MNIIRVRNVHRALPVACAALKQVGEERDSRNGKVLQSPMPVATTYLEPTERVLFWAERDANPFFHLFESIWMLGGTNDVESVAYFAKNVSNYSDDGETFHASYGHRWQHLVATGSRDQIELIIDAIRSNQDDRRLVLQMWRSDMDLGKVGKDVPCNLIATFQCDSGGKLNLVVFCRSNDVVWGCYGANAVQFSVLLEYVALRAGLKVGTYTQVSVNWHGYRNTFDPLYDGLAAYSSRVTDENIKQDHPLETILHEPSPYELGIVRPYPLIAEGTDSGDWKAGLRNLLRSKGRAPAREFWPDPFFYEVLIPMLRAHDAFRQREGNARYEGALEELKNCRASDWAVAGFEWISRRWAKYKEEEHS